MSRCAAEANNGSQCKRLGHYPLDRPRVCWGHATKYERDSIYRAERCRACNGTGRVFKKAKP